MMSKRRGSLLACLLIAVACSGATRSGTASAKPGVAAPARLSIHATLTRVVIDTWTGETVGPPGQERRLDIVAVDKDPRLDQVSTCFSLSVACRTDDLRGRENGTPIGPRGVFELAPATPGSSGPRCASLVYALGAGPREHYLVCDGGSPGKAPSDIPHFGSEIGPTRDYMQYLNSSPRYRAMLWVASGQIHLVAHGSERFGSGS